MNTNGSVGAASPCGWSSSGKGRGSCGKGKRRSLLWALDTPGAGGKKEGGQLGSVGSFIARRTRVWIYSTSASLRQCLCACSHPGDVRSRAGRDTGCIAFTAGATRQGHLQLANYTAAADAQQLITPQQPVPLLEFLFKGPAST